MKQIYQGRLLKEVEKARDMAVIVEGKRDAEALRELGFNNITVLHREGISIYSVIDEIAESRPDSDVAILTDMDSKGKQYHDLLKRELAMRGIRVNDNLRKELIKERISHVEGLATFLKNRGLAL